MNNDSKISFVLHWLKGVKMEAQTSPYLRFALGTSMLIASASMLIAAIAPNGIF